jgi:hypothetical protein
MKPLFVSRKRYERLVGEAAYADEQNTATTIVNQRLTEDLATTRRELADVRKVEESLARQIHEMAQPVEPSDEEVDAAQLRLELDAERSRADHLQKELDNALGMPPGGILNSGPWQPGYEAQKPDKAVSP